MEWLLDHYNLDAIFAVGYRASERRFYQKITDIYATATDYNPNTDFSRQFFATMQNKLYYAIHRHTAAELIAKRADAKLEKKHNKRIKKT